MTSSPNYAVPLLAPDAAEVLDLAALAERFFAAAVLLAPARLAAHRFLRTATIFRLPAADSFRLGFAALAVSGSAAAFWAAHRFL